jgi:hypothetical protein
MNTLFQFILIVVTVLVFTSPVLTFGVFVFRNENLT